MFTFAFICILERDFTGFVNDETKKAAASRYKQFMSLLDSWTIVKTGERPGRSHKRVNTAFHKGAATSDIDVEACNKSLASLSHTHSDLYKSTYICESASTFSRHNLDDLRKVTSTEATQLIQKKHKRHTKTAEPDQ